MGMKTPREKFMILFLVILVVLAAWYMLFYSPTNDIINEMLGNPDNPEEEPGYMGELKQYNQGLVDQINVYKRWQEQLGIDLNDDSDDFVKIKDYNDIVGLTDTMNQILSPTTKFSLTYKTPEKVPEKKAYRRDITVSFSTNNYQEAYDIINKLDSLESGCLIDNLAVSVTENETNISLSVSIFEYYDPNAKKEENTEQS